MPTSALPLHFDSQAFADELDALRARSRAEIGPEDLSHLRKIERWGRLASSVGWGTAWLAPNPFSAFLIAQGRTTRWAMVGHHVLHRGYDNVPGVPPSRTSRVFARGWRRRLVDWNDWIDPAAWSHEHNQLHHYNLGEEADPDYMEMNTDWLRNAKWPVFIKYLVIAFFAATWKWSYYAPNTLRYWIANRSGKNAITPRDDLPSLGSMFLRPYFWLRCILPYSLVNFVLLPALLLLVSPWAALSMLLNSLLAELITNVHCFAIITTNHVGDDIYAFEGRPVGRGGFYLRQVMGSTNFATGGDLNDFMHGWLNYQIEHHLFADLPMRAYQRIQPEVRAICERHGVPYVQESVWTRVRKTLNVMTGHSDMLRMPNDALA
jgi:fatty acid desaturase